jgi:DHA1 family L-arabinose/isopropyl-beta-D-thiogalactopyranoside export protein-like MFS transporter/DHA1 family inner membrane transport protein
MAVECEDSRAHDAPPIAEVSPRRAVGALVALSIATFCYVTTELLPVGLLTLIADDLDMSRSHTGLLVTAYATVVVIASIPLTRRTQRIPRRWLLSVTLGLFAAATLMASLASTFPLLLAARLLTGLTQAMFWSVVIPAAAGLFPPLVRGKVIARMAIGTSLAPVLGVPAATWLGQQAGWRVSFLVMAVAGLATAAAVLALMPTVPPLAAATARGSAPDTGRYVNLVVVTILSVTGFFAAYTYITPFLLDVSRFPAASLSALLLVAGVAGLCGTVAVGTVLDRHPRGTLLVPLGLISLWLAGLYVFGPAKAAAVGLLMMLSFTFSALPPAISARTLHVAPGSTDLASAGISSAFNVGIAGGSLLGGLIVAGMGARSVALAGALLMAAALTVMLVESQMATSPAAKAG